MFPFPLAISEPTVFALQTVAVAVLVFLGQYVVAKLSKQANRETVTVGAQEKATAAWKDYAEEMKQRLDAMENRLGDAERRIRHLEHQSNLDIDLISRLSYRLRAALTDIVRLGGAAAEADHDLLDAAERRLIEDQEN